MSRTRSSCPDVDPAELALAIALAEAAVANMELRRPKPYANAKVDRPFDDPATEAGRVLLVEIIGRRERKAKADARNARRRLVNLLKRRQHKAGTVAGIVVGLSASERDGSDRLYAIAGTGKARPILAPVPA